MNSMWRGGIAPLRQFLDTARCLRVRVDSCPRVWRHEAIALMRMHRQEKKHVCPAHTRICNNSKRHPVGRHVLREKKLRIAPRDSKHPPRGHCHIAAYQRSRKMIRVQAYSFFVLSHPAVIVQVVANKNQTYDNIRMETKLSVDSIDIPRPVVRSS